MAPLGAMLENEPIGFPCQPLKGITMQHVALTILSVFMAACAVGLVYGIIGLVKSLNR